MELNITATFRAIRGNARKYSASQAELGSNAGAITWANANDAAKDMCPLRTSDQMQAMREFVKDSGGWSAEEIAAFSDQELNALLVQWIAGDIRESLGLDGARIDWPRYYRECETGRNPSRFFNSGRKVFFYLGS